MWSLSNQSVPFFATEIVDKYCIAFVVVDLHTLLFVIIVKLVRPLISHSSDYVVRQMLSGERGFVHCFFQALQRILLYFDQFEAKVKAMIRVLERPSLANFEIKFLWSKKEFEIRILYFYLYFPFFFPFFSTYFWATVFLWVRGHLPPAS